MMKNTIIRTVSSSMFNLIKQWEGLHLKAYKCPGNVLTIGYGHTDGNIKPDMSITEDEALDLLHQDIDRTAKAVNMMAQENRCLLNSHQFDALVSLAFNIGTDALQRSTLWLKVIKDPDDNSIGNEFGRWVYANKKKQPGLVTRRHKERDIYMNGCYE